ncbi:MAG: ABC transporter permease, partial [Gemmatimonadaceae bacterium]|nr:ABC transporter permease [Acetobacteraceae bacterium]
AAGLLGIRVGAIRCLLYGASGLFAGLTGVCVIGYTGTSFISVGDQYVLPSIIAVVIGGTSLAGGAGGYLGTVLGAVALVLLQSVLTTVQIESWGRQVIFGATLLGLMLLYGRQARLRI